MPYKASADFNGIKVLPPAGQFKACRACGTALDKWSEILDSPKRPGRKDFSLSFDGFTVVSPKFRRVCDEAGVVNVEFRPLSSGFFILRPERVVAIDVVHQRLKFIKPCPECGVCEEVLVHGPSRLEVGEAPIGELEIVRPSVETGHKTMRGFYTYIGDAVCRAFVYGELTGMALTEMDPQLDG